MREIAVIAFICTLLLAGCNENLAVHLDDAVHDSSGTKGTILYTGYSFQVMRLNIDGSNYLVNTKGGIVLEPKK